MNTPHSLPRPAALGKNRTPRVDGALQQAGELERFVAFRAGRQQTRALQCIGCEDFLVYPVWRRLGFFVHRLAGYVIQHTKGQQKHRPEWTHRETALFPSPDAFMTSVEPQDAWHKWVITAPCQTFSRGIDRRQRRDDVPRQRPCFLAPSREKARPAPGYHASASGVDLTFAIPVAGNT
jgi:hypothetical protein